MAQVWQSVAPMIRFMQKLRLPFACLAAASMACAAGCRRDEATLAADFLHLLQSLHVDAND